MFALTEPQPSAAPREVSHLQMSTSQAPAHALAIGQPYGLLTHPLSRKAAAPLGLARLGCCHHPGGTGEGQRAQRNGAEDEANGTCH